MTKVRIKKTSPDVWTPPSWYVYYFVDENDWLLKQIDENWEVKTVTNPATFTPELKDKLDSVEYWANAYNIVNDLVNDLTTGWETKALTAEQGKILKQAIDNINQILESDDTDLDTLQEIVDFIQQNKEDLENLTIDNIAWLQEALDSKAPIWHTHTSSEIVDIQSTIENNEVVVANTTARHTHNNKALLDAITNSGSWEKFLADDWEYKYVNYCQSVDKLVFPTIEPEYAIEQWTAKIFFDWTTMCFSTTDNIVKVWRLTPYVEAVDKTKISINNLTDVHILWWNFDINTRIFFNTDPSIASLVWYDVLSNDEIVLHIQTYANTGNIEVKLSNWVWYHFWHDINIEVVIKKELDEVNTSFINNAANVAALIANQYNFSWWDSWTYISDGGNDMYDWWNKIYTNLWWPLYYTNWAIRTETRLWTNWKYFTKKANYVFFAGFDIDNIQRIKIDWNLGADWRGSYNRWTFVLDWFRIYWKTVWWTWDPSINHIWILENNDYTSQIIWTTTDSDLDKIVNLDQANIDRIYYTLYAKASWEQSPIDEITNVAQYLINNVIL